MAERAVSPYWFEGKKLEENEGKFCCFGLMRYICGKIDAYEINLVFSFSENTWQCQFRGIDFHACTVNDPRGRYGELGEFVKSRHIL